MFCGLARQRPRLARAPSGGWRHDLGQSPGTRRGGTMKLTSSKLRRRLQRQAIEALCPAARRLARPFPRRGLAVCRFLLAAAHRPASPRRPPCIRCATGGIVIAIRPENLDYTESAGAPADPQRHERRHRTGTDAAALPFGVRFCRCDSGTNRGRSGAPPLQRTRLRPTLECSRRQTNDSWIQLCPPWRQHFVRAARNARAPQASQRLTRDRQGRAR